MSLLSPLADRTFARLFGAQVSALVGTGLLTIALALFAYELAGEEGGAVLGTALAIKMIAYVSIAPLAAGLLAGLPRRAVLVGLDLVRGGVALCLPFVDQVWQVYVLIFVLQSASAAFTPAFQATIPDILSDEAQYTRALSLSRLAYDLENLASPMIAAALLLLVPFSVLFVGTAAGFAASALLVFWARPPRAAQVERNAWARTTRGLSIYARTPRLRGLFALNMAAASGGAMVIVNTAIVVRAGYGRGEADVALAMAAFGAGSMMAALLLPRLLERVGDRALMLSAAAALGATLFALAARFLAGLPPWPVFLGSLSLLGLFYAGILTPSGRLLRRSANADDRPALFAAQFALSHASWLLAYPLAGWAGAGIGQGPTFAVMAGLALAAALLARHLWPAGDPDVVLHEHRNLPPEDPHLQGAQPAESGWQHAHAYLIDDRHPSWPAAEPAILTRRPEAGR